jgi:hypothetical protein
MGHSDLSGSGYPLHISLMIEKVSETKDFWTDVADHPK